MPTENFTRLKTDRKNSIIKAMTREFATQDYDAISVRDISDQAGISRGSFYLYFKDKEDAFLTVVDNYRQRVEQDLLNIYEKANDIPSIVMEIFDYFTHLSSFEHSLLEKISNNLSVEVQDIISSAFEQFGETINKYLEDRLKEKGIEITAESLESINLRREILFSLLISSLLELSIKHSSLEQTRTILKKKIDIVMAGEVNKF